VLVLRKVTAKTAANGNPFLSVELGDRTGSFSCTVFSDSPVFEAIRGAAEGAVLRVEGKTDSFQGRLSPRLSRAVRLTEEELAAPDVLAQLVERSAEDPAALWADCLAAAAAIVRPELRATVLAVLEDLGDAFRNAPAAVSMHHAYRHGLLEHTVHMARAARALLPLYPEVDADLALAGILLHDTGKTIEYEGALATRRSRRGLLQGHVVLGYQLVRRAALKAKLDPELVERLEHIILSHQGELAWGAAALAATPEAVFVSMIDNLDARMGMVQQALRQAIPGEEFSDRIAGLGGPLLTRRPPA
jgi:3'-5' exoribonuclease